MRWKYSATSMFKLKSCDVRLQMVAHVALLLSEVDITVVEGHRSVLEQQKLYAQGRSESGDIVTYADGLNVKSKHNHKPSQAIDLAPYVAGKGIVWDLSENLDKWIALNDAVQEAAKITAVPIEWGGDWNSFKDYPHYQLAEDNDQWIKK